MAMKLWTGLAAALSIALGAVPAPAQIADSTNFLKAVRERDGNSAQGLLAASGPVIVNTKGDDGLGALHIVARERDTAWLDFLLGKGARPDIQDRNGATPLAIATQLGWTEGAQILIAHGAAVDLGNSRGETPLMLAVHNRDANMVRLLLAAGASPTRTDRSSGYSALDYARQDPRTAAIAKLLEAPAPGPRKAFGPKL